MKKQLFSMALMICIYQVVHSQAVWTQKASYPGLGSTEFRAFSVNDMVYVGGPTTQFWQYDPSTDVWTQMATFIGGQRSSPVAFAIGSKGYLGTGGSYNDFYEYDAINNTWLQVANFGGSGREGALGIAINGKGYVGTGGNYLNDWWEFDPVTNTWTQKANLNGPGRYHGGAFAIGGYGYICTGFNGVFMNDLLQYDPVNNTWTTKTSLPATTRDRPVAFSIGNKGYIATGWSGSISLNDCWEYNPATDSWTQMPDFGGNAGYNACAAATSGKAYAGMGSSMANSWWEFGNVCAAQFTTVDATCFTACNGSANIVSPDSASVVSYLWSTGQSQASISNLCPGTYTVTVTDTSGCVSVNTVTINSLPPMVSTFTVQQPDCFGNTNGSICAAVSNGAPPYTFLWANGSTDNCLNNVPGGNYNVMVSDAAGCTQNFAGVLTQPAAINISISHQDATCPTCNNGSASASISGGIPPFTYAWSNGSVSAFLPSLLPGTYTVCVTDANGCSQCDSVTIGSLTGLTENDHSDLVVMPAIVTDHIICQLPPLNGKQADVFILDAAGRLVYNEQFSTRELFISLRHFKPGVYTVRFIVNDRIQCQSFVKLND